MTIQMTVGEVNERLKLAGIPQITSVELKDELYRLRSGDRIMQAVSICLKDAGAHKFLMNLMTEAQRNLEHRAKQRGDTAPRSPATQGGEHTPSPDPVHTRHSRSTPSTAGQQPPLEPRPERENAPSAQDNSPPARNQERPRPAATSGAREAAQPRDNASAPADTREFVSHHVYGGKAALCFEADTTRSDAHTIALDAAPTVATRKYDWANKTRVQMTVNELPFVTAVLMGLLPRCEYKNHGPDNNKGFSMERQDGGKVFVRVFEGEKGVKAVPVEAADVYHVAGLCMRQLMLNAPWLDATGILATLRTTVTPTANSQAGRRQAA